MHIEFDWSLLNSPASKQRTNAIACAPTCLLITLIYRSYGLVKFLGWPAKIFRLENDQFKGRILLYVDKENQISIDQTHRSIDAQLLIHKPS